MHNTQRFQVEFRESTHAQTMSVDDDVAIELSSLSPGGDNGALWALPRELFAAVLLHLDDVRDICAVTRCCKAYRERICCVPGPNSDRFWFTAFWRELFERDSARWSAFESNVSASAAAAPASQSSSSSSSSSSSFLGAWVRNLSAVVATIASALDGEEASSSAIGDADDVLLASMSEDERRRFHARHSTPWSEASWYACYVHQYAINARSHRLSTVQSPPALTHMHNAHAAPPRRSIFAEWAGMPQGVYRVPMFGIGERSTAKKYLYRMMHEPNMGLKVTRLHRGLGIATGGLGAGVGFDFDGVELSLTVLQMAPDEHKKASAQRANVWTQLVGDAPCCVFILGPQDSSRRAFVELQNNLSPRWAAPDTPLVVVSLYDPAAFADDDADDRNAMLSSGELEVPMAPDGVGDQFEDDDDAPVERKCPLVAQPQLRSNPRQVATALRLGELKRPWIVYTTNILNPTNVGAALRYAADQVQARAWAQRKLKI